MLPEAKHEAICAACKGGRCCVQYRVEILGSDLYRLVKGLTLAPQEFVYLARFAHGVDIPHPIFLSRERTPYQLCLQKKPAKKSKKPKPDSIKSTEPCIFLVEFDAFTKRCGVYPHRPMVCRTFPTTSTTFGIDVPQRDACPPRAWTIERVDIPTAHLLHTLARIERDIYIAFLEHWNTIADATPEDRRLSPDAFYFSLLKFYGALDEAKSACFDLPDTQTALALGWRRAAQLHSQPWTLIHTERQAEVELQAGPVAAAFLRAVHHHLGQFATTARALAAAGRAQINHALADKLARLNALMSPQPPTPSPEP